MCSSSRERDQAARRSGPGARSNGPPDLVAGQLERVRLAGGGGLAGQVDERDGNGQRRRNHLVRDAPARRERRAQHFVAGDNHVDHGRQRWDVQCAAQPHDGRDIVEEVSRLELVEEPQALLSERQWQSQRDAAGTGMMGGAGSVSSTARAAASCAAMPATVGASNRLRSANSTPNTSRMREARRVARSEWPPRSKKLSVDTDPRRGPGLGQRRPQASPRPGCAALHTRPSRREFGSRRAPASARRSTLPVALSGSAGRATNADGIM